MINYSNSLRSLIESFTQAKDAFYFAGQSIESSLNQSLEIINETAIIADVAIKNLDADGAALEKAAGEYIDYLKQIQARTENDEKENVNTENKTLQEMDDLKQLLSIEAKKTEKEREIEKTRLAETGRDLAEVHIRINNHTATRNDFQKSADLLEKYQSLVKNVYGVKLKEQEIKSKTAAASAKKELEYAMQYAETSKGWASKIAQLKELAGFAEKDYEKFSQSINNKQEEYSKDDLADLIKQAQLKAIENYQWKEVRELGRALYKVKNNYGNYQLDLSFGSKRLTIFGDGDIEGFIAKLKSIGLIN